MALDGIAISNIVCELNKKLLGGRVDKIYQPRADEVIFSVRSLGNNYKVLLSANSMNPRIHITDIQKENPMSPPMFCMVLRKYIAGGKILSITQPNFERIINIDIETMNEMGDMSFKRLIIEIMGKHSNVILTDENEKVLDSIKHVSHDKSSVRQVLPGTIYFLPPSQGKYNPLYLDYDIFFKSWQSSHGTKLQSFIYKTFTGISPVMASEICHRASLDASSYIAEINSSSAERLFAEFKNVMDDTRLGNYMPEIIYESDTKKIVDFSSLEMTQYSSAFIKRHYESISELLEAFYSERDNLLHIQQKAHDMRRLIISNIERCVKKKEIQLKTLKSIEHKDLWKTKGELLTANIYSLEKGMDKFITANYYDESMPDIEISLDPNLTPSENAQRYFNKYNKAKRTIAALEIQKKQNDEELSYLESVLSALDISNENADLLEIKNELVSEGFMKKKKIAKGKTQKVKKASPLHFVSSDGFDIYVGKSNTQNDELTLRFAESSDIWLHTKNIPGSHVIIKMNGATVLPDATLLEAASLAAYNSKARASSQVPVDYTPRKFVKKPGGAKPGMVIYDRNNTIYVTPEEIMINNIKKIF